MTLPVAVAGRALAKAWVRNTGALRLTSRFACQVLASSVESPSQSKRAALLIRQVGVPERFGASLDQGRDRLQPGEIGAKRRRDPAIPHDLGNELQGLFGRIPVMDADPPSPSREIQSNAAPEPAPRAGHENGPGILVLSHAVCGKLLWRIESRSEFACREPL